MLLAETNRPVPRLVFRKHTAKHPAVTAIHLAGAFPHVLLRKATGVERPFSLVQRLVPQVLFQRVQDRIVWRTHRVVVPDGLVPQIDNRHAPVHSAHVNRHGNYVVGEDVHLPGPPL